MNKVGDIMNDIQLFDFEGQEVRTVLKDNEVWFVGKDVCNVLGFGNYRDALSRHVDDEDKIDGVGITDSMGRSQNPTLINESGVYALIFGSRLPSAKKFKHWVTSEVLPTIRKTGQYEVVKDSYMIEDPIERAKRWIEEQEEKKQLLLVNQQQEQQIAELKPKADYMDKILQSKDCLTVRQIAMDYGMTPQAMNKLLHDLGVQYKQSGQWFLYSKYLSSGYTKSNTFIDKYGYPRMSTKWTQKGRLFLYDLLKAHDVLPVIERDDIDIEQEAA